MDWEGAARKLDRFSRRSSTTDCIEWVGGKDWDGYGMVRLFGRQYRAHRLAWMVASRSEIDPGLVVRHTCDNPPCVNPLHLLIGTVADNNRDRELRGRSSDRRGEKCPTAKLSWPEIHVIRRRVQIGDSHSVIALDFGVSRKAVSKIARYETWRVDGAA